MGTDLPAPRVGPLSAVLFVLLALGTLTACTESPDRNSGLAGKETRVLVVARDSDPVSRRIAEYYARARGIRPGHVVFLKLPRTEELSRTAFERELVKPIADWWNGTPAESRPDFIVLTKGVPHRIYGDGDLTGSRASVDSELCDLPSFAAGVVPPATGRRRNPYGRGSNAEFPPFSSTLYGICLVTRLDGFGEEDAIDLIDRALAAEKYFRAAPQGDLSGTEEDPPRFLFDQSGATSVGNDWLDAAGERLERFPAPPVPYRVEVDSSVDFVEESRNLLGYASWGSNDPRFIRGVDFTWAPGGLATTFVSSSARTFRSPPEGWSPGPAGITDDFEGSRQSLTADWIRSGATGAAGNAFEPYLDACVRPQILFPAYLSGRNLAEAFYLALPYLSWQSVVIGDPLCAPFGGSGAEDMAPPLR